MRENMCLCRGKRKRDGVWIEGPLLFVEGKPAIFEQSAPDSSATWSYGEAHLWGCSEVDPETVGQFIGRPCHGKKVFEGDIVKAKVIMNQWSKTREYTATFVVAWHPSNCYFYLKREGNNLLFDGNWNYGVFINEVIGNIHDTPELKED